MLCIVGTGIVSESKGECVVASGFRWLYLRFRIDSLRRPGRVGGWTRRFRIFFRVLHGRSFAGFSCLALPVPFGIKGRCFPVFPLPRVSASMLLDQEHCCLCGIRFAPGMKRRMQDRQELTAFVTRRCWPTPFLFQALSCRHASVQGRGGRLGVCIPCVNWKRRVMEVASSKRRRRLPMLQLDQLIYYLLRPGVHAEPDRRCMGRLLAGSRQADNPFRPLFPLPVQTILSALKRDTYGACIEAWWEYNGRTEFFASGGEAKRVRSLLHRLDE